MCEGAGPGRTSVRGIALAVGFDLRGRKPDVPSLLSHRREEVLPDWTLLCREVSLVCGA